MHSIPEYSSLFIEYLEEKSTVKQPQNLYKPIDYILKLGGKRLRPILTLLAAELLDSDYKKALDAALAIEIFHNFSLVHDDIMDDAPLRRGKQTVHEKWNINTGILSGDAMLIQAYQLFENYEGDTFRELAKVFSKTAIEVCEGQQYDVDFEIRNDVTISEYLKMIEYKTAVLGDPKTFGKQVGGDIIENKKTFLYITALQKSKKEEAQLLEALFSTTPNNPTDKIETVKEQFIKSGAAKATQEEILKYTQKAFESLEKVNVSENKKQLLRDFGTDLMKRTV